MFTKLLDHLEEWIITFLMAGATLIIFLSVAHRYGTGLPIPGVQDYLLSLHFEWAQELAIIMFVWMAKFGAAYGVRMGVHVGVDVLVSRLPDAWRRRATYVALACGMLFTGIIGTLGLTFVWENGLHYALFNKLGMDISALTEGPTTPDLEWPTWFIYSVGADGLLPDVLPLHPGVAGLLAHRRDAAPGRIARRRPGRCRR